MPLSPITGFERANLQIEGDPGPLDCWFNPKEFSITKVNTWNTKPVVGTALPTAQFGGGQPRKLNLELLFDSTDTNPPLDVAGVARRLLKMMEVQPSLGGAHGKNSGRPPTVTFNWGTNTPFKAVCDNLTVQFTLFASNGTPVRAQARVSLVQAEPAMDSSSTRGTGRRTNPTTRATPGLGSHTVRDGDSLASIAFEHYRDPTRWRAIAQENGIDDPLHLKRGSVLSIPRVEE